MARRPGPSLRALLFRCGEGAVCEPSRLEDRQLRELVFLSVQKATLGTGGRGPVRPSGPCCFGVTKAPFVSLRGRQTAQRASFLVGSESNVRNWGPWPAGPVRPSGPCCFGVAKAPFVSLRGWNAGPVRPSGPCCFGVAKAPFVSLRGWKTDSSES